MLAPLANRLSQIQPFHVVRMLLRARELEAAGRDIIHMEIGEPDFPLAAPLRDAAAAALSGSALGYAPSAGLPALRDCIAAQYAASGIDVPVSRILVTPGGSGALMIAMALVANAGERVLLPDPGYPCNRNFVHHLDAVPVAVPVSAAAGHHLTVSDLEAAAAGPSRIAAAMVSSPSNPAGTLIDPAQLDAMRCWLGARGAALLVDEIYHDLIYREQPVQSALALGDDLFVINSFSKSFGMTGWRLGWLVVPPGFEDAALRLAQNLFIAAPSIAQHVALAGFGADAQAIFAERRRELAARRDWLLPALEQLGFAVPASPEGAFYIYADCRRFGLPADTLCRELLDDVGVALTPGLDFGEHAVTDRLRFAYTCALPRLREAVDRIGGWLSARGLVPSR